MRAARVRYRTTTLFRAVFAPMPEIASATFTGCV
jgi:hypothetical protein